MKNRLFLIDGHALVFKMYYAFLRHPMINSKGADMSILFGFTKYILELIEREKQLILLWRSTLREGHSDMKCIPNTRVREARPHSW